jgi:hypothetical protein
VTPVRPLRVVRIPNGDQAGQIIGFPGEKGIYIPLTQL